MKICITGASSGIGQAVARRYVGHDLFLVGRDGARLNQTLPGSRTLVADLTEGQAIGWLGRTLAAEAGQLDLLINCAGQLEVGPTRFEMVERLMRVNFLATAALIDELLPLLGRGAVIVNVTSLAGRLAPPFMAAYAASKFALEGYTRSLRQELRPRGIHVGLIAPGPVATPMVEGKLGGRYYPRLPGVPVLTAETVAAAVERLVRRRQAEVILPYAAVSRLGAAFPQLVDLLYRGRAK